MNVMSCEVMPFLVCFSQLILRCDENMKMCFGSDLWSMILYQSFRYFTPNSSDLIQYSWAPEKDSALPLCIWMVWMSDTNGNIYAILSLCWLALNAIICMLCSDKSIPLILSISSALILILKLTLNSTKASNPRMSITKGYEAKKSKMVVHFSASVFKLHICLYFIKKLKLISKNSLMSVIF